MHPMVGLQLLTLGRLYAASEQQAKARAVLKDAKDLLTLTHGADHPLLRQHKELHFALEEP